MAKALTVQLEIPLAFRVAQLCPGDVHQIVSQIAGEKGGREHGLPVTQGLYIGGLVGIAVEGVLMLRLVAEQGITFTGMDMVSICGDGAGQRRF